MSVTWEKDGDVLVLTGRITEDAPLEKLEEELEGSEIHTVDAAGISRINSAGTKRWLAFVAKVGKRLRFKRCSPAFVEQLNMVANFTGGGEVISVLLPYVCPACDHEEERLLVLEDGMNIADLLPCPACGDEMEFDALREQYLRFAT